MNKGRLLLPIILLTAITLAACGGTAAQENAPLGSGPPGARSDAVQSRASASAVSAPESPGDMTAGDAMASGSPEAQTSSPSHRASKSMESARESAGESGGESGAGPKAGPEAPIEAAASTDGMKAVEAGPAVELRGLFSQAMSSPELLQCLSSQVGMETLSQLTGRPPTAEESRAIRACLDGTEAPKTVPASAAAPVETTAAAPRTLLDQALASPGLMWCLAGKMGLESLSQLDRREPTAQEKMIAQMCANDRQEIASGTRVAQKGRCRVHAMGMWQPSGRG